MKKNLFFSLIALFFLSVNINAQLNPILMLSFDNADNLTENAQSVNSIYNGAISVEGKNGLAAQFTADESTYIKMDSIADYDILNKNVVFAWWMKTSVSGGQDIWAYSGNVDGSSSVEQGGIAASLSTTDFMGIDISWIGGNLEEGVTENNTPGLLIDDQWHHVAFVVHANEASMRIYIDGNFIEEIPGGDLASAGFPVSGHGLLLGAAGIDWPCGEFDCALQYEGLIDDFGIFQSSNDVSDQDITNILEGNVTNVANVISAADYRVYPNPAKDYVVLNQNSSELSIYQITGKKVMSITNYESGSEISLDNLSAGIYFLTTKERSLKLIVE